MRPGLRLRGAGCGGSKPEEAKDEDAKQPPSNIPKPQVQVNENDDTPSVSKRRGAPAAPTKAALPPLAVPENAESSVADPNPAEKGGGSDANGASGGADDEHETEMLRETLKATREALGNEHASTLTAINNLAAMLHDKGDLEEAGTLFREALAARRNTLGNQDQSTLTSINNLGLLLQDLAFYRAILKVDEELLEEAIGERERKPGSRLPSMPPSTSKRARSFLSPSKCTP